MKLRTTVAAGVLLLYGAGTAAAQDDEVPDITDIEIPTLVLDTGPGDDVEDGGDIDLANIVQSAARSVTTVQEAPAIVTVITEDEIKERRVKRLDDLVDGAVPGFLQVDTLYGQFPQATARGQIQAVQLLIDGISMFDPFVNVATANQVQPIELIKRIEVISGPGGVLWGSNSLLGITNVITKDAEDVDGVEVGVDLGHGNGDRQYFHAYVMAGKTGLFSDDSKVFFHGSFKTYKGQATENPNHLFSQPLPNPNSPVYFGPLTTSDQVQSVMFTAFLKLTLSNSTQFRLSVPFQERHLPGTFPGAIIRENQPEDSRPECNDGVDPVLEGCPDESRRARENTIDAFDRYAVLEYKTRVGGGKAGISAKLYAAQFVRNFKHIQILPASEPLLEGGLGFGFDATTYRPGVAVDGDFELGRKARVLYGFEGFREFALNDVSTSRQGDGIQATFFGPLNEGLLPLPCPLTRDLTTMQPVFIDGCPLTFAFPSDRTVLGAYISPEVRPTKKLILGAGARAQIAPEALNDRQPYDLTTTFGASAVYSLGRGYHLKGQFTQGFRPPAFNNVSSNGEAVQIDGRRDLNVETTDAVQFELNGRIFKGDRRIRELDFRVDYSYTRMQNLIQIVSGRYENTADRGLHSGELLATLYIDGGHKLQLGYTYLRVDTADKGRVRTLPNNWFNLLAVFNLVDDKLSASTNLRVVGAFEDPNRLVEYRNIHYCGAGEAGCMAGDIVGGPIITAPTDLVLDRMPPTATLSGGLTYMASDKLTIEADVWNALDGRNYAADVFGEYEPRLEFTPNPERGFRAYLGATYTY